MKRNLRNWRQADDRQPRVVAGLLPGGDIATAFELGGIELPTMAPREGVATRSCFQTRRLILEHCTQHCSPAVESSLDA